MPMTTKETFDFSTLCRHCEQETSVPIPAAVTGSIPDYVEGTYIYNGPGRTRVGSQEYKHCFDSSALLQKVKISSSGSSYSSRFLRSSTYERNTEAGAITVTEFGTGAVDPPKGFFAKLKKMTDMESAMSDNAVVTVETIADQLYALGETPFLQQVDPKSLDVKSKKSLYKDLGLVTMCPHPVKDSSGHSYTVAQTVSITGPKYCIVKMAADGSNPAIVAKVQPRWRLAPCYMHSIAITDNYLILLEPPMSVSVTDVVSDMINSAPFIQGVKWHADDSALIHVIDMRTWQVVKTKFSLPTMFMIHFANSYEDGSGNIILDFPSYSNSDFLQAMYIENLRKVKGDAARELAKSFSNNIIRVTLPVESSSGAEVSVEPKVLTTSSFENPQVNPNYEGKCHRYIYGTGQSPEGNNYGQVTKLDVTTGEVKLFTEEGFYYCEPIVVPKPGSTAEDDATLVIYSVVSGDPKKGSLLMLDAATLKEVARVTYTTSAEVPLPLHGLKLPTTGPLSNQQG